MFITYFFLFFFLSSFFHYEWIQMRVWRLNSAYKFRDTALFGHNVKLILQRSWRDTTWTQNQLRVQLCEWPFNKCCSIVKNYRFEELSNSFLKEGHLTKHPFAFKGSMWVHHYLVLHQSCSRSSTQIYEWTKIFVLSRHVGV